MGKKNFNLRKDEIVSYKVVPRGTRVKTVNTLKKDNCYTNHDVPCGTEVVITDEQGCFVYHREWRYDKQYEIV